MSEAWAHQIRVYLSEPFARLARDAPDDPALAPLTALLAAHGARLVCQADAFAAYVAEAERALAEQKGVEAFPLYKWTKATLADPEKLAKHQLAFAVRVGGAEVYPKPVADNLVAALQPLVDGTVITRLSRHDTNPATAIPVPAEHR